MNEKINIKKSTKNISNDILQRKQAEINVFKKSITLHTLSNENIFL